jgi:hypothetical protein
VNPSIVIGNAAARDLVVIVEFGREDHPLGRLSRHAHSVAQ